LDCGKLANSGGNGGIPQNRCSRYARRDLLDQLKPFPSDGIFERRKSSTVAARPRQAFDETAAHRIGDDRNSRSMLLHGASPIISGAASENRPDAVGFAETYFPSLLIPRKQVALGLTIPSAPRGLAEEVIE
jgi:hypothetical protein